MIWVAAMWVISFKFRATVGMHPSSGCPAVRVASVRGQCHFRDFHMPLFVEKHLAQLPEQSNSIRARFPFARHKEAT